MKLRWLVLVSILMCSLWPAPVAGHGDTLTSALSLEGRGGAPSPRLSPWKGKGEAPEGGWQQETITGDYTTVGYDYEYSLALDGSGRAHVIYYDFADSGWYYLNHARRSGGTWKIDRVDVDYYAGFSNDIAIGSDGKLHVAYSIMHGLNYAWCITETWHVRTIDWVKHHEYEFVSIQLSTNDQPQIVYSEDSHAGDGFNALRYAFFDPDQEKWQINTVVDGRVDSVNFLMTNKPYIAYNEGDFIKFAQPGGSTWQVETVAAGYISRNSLIVGSGGGPCLLYTARKDANQPQDRLLYACRSTGWKPLLVAAGSRNGAMTADAAGNPHVFYYSYNQVESNLSPDSEGSTSAGNRHATLSAGAWVSESYDGGFREVAFSGGNLHTLYGASSGGGPSQLTYGWGTATIASYKIEVTPTWLGYTAHPTKLPQAVVTPFDQPAVKDATQSISVKVVGKTLPWSASGPDWLDLQPSLGQTPAEIKVMPVLQSNDLAGLGKRSAAIHIGLQESGGALIDVALPVDLYTDPPRYLEPGPLLTFLQTYGYTSLPLSLTPYPAGTVLLWTMITETGGRVAYAHSTTVTDGHGMVEMSTASHWLGAGQNPVPNKGRYELAEAWAPPTTFDQAAVATVFANNAVPREMGTARAWNCHGFTANVVYRAVLSPVRVKPPAEVEKTEDGWKVQSGSLWYDSRTAGGTSISGTLSTPRGTFYLKSQALVNVNADASADFYLLEGHADYASGNYTATLITNQMVHIDAAGVPGKVTSFTPSSLDAWWQTTVITPGVMTLESYLPLVRKSEADRCVMRATAPYIFVRWELIIKYKIQPLNVKPGRSAE